MRLPTALENAVPDLFGVNYPYRLILCCRFGSPSPLGSQADSVRRIKQFLTLNSSPVGKRLHCSIPAHFQHSSRFVSSIPFLETIVRHVMQIVMACIARIAIHLDKRRRFDLVWIRAWWLENSGVNYP